MYFAVVLHRAENVQYIIITVATNGELKINVED